MNIKNVFNQKEIELNHNQHDRKYPCRYDYCVNYTSIDQLLCDDCITKDIHLCYQCNQNYCEYNFCEYCLYDLYGTDEHE